MPDDTGLLTTRSFYNLISSKFYFYIFTIHHQILLSANSNKTNMRQNIIFIKKLIKITELVSEEKNEITERAPPFIAQQDCRTANLI